MGPRGEQGPPGPIGPRGPQGEIGPPGTLELPVAYFITANDDLDTYGIPISSNQRIPIEVKTIDIGSNFTLSDDNIITFKKPGVYRVDFMIQAFSTKTLLTPTNYGIVAAGFKKVGEPTIYVGGSTWDYQEPCTRLNAHGILSTTLENEEFELVNISTDQINLVSPNISNLTSISLFSNTIVTLIIEKIQ